MVDEEGRDWVSFCVSVYFVGHWHKGRRSDFIVGHRPGFSVGRWPGFSVGLWPGFSVGHRPCFSVGHWPGFVVGWRPGVFISGQWLNFVGVDGESGAVLGCILGVISGWGCGG